MTIGTLVTRFDDKPFRFIFKSLVRNVSYEEGQELCLKYPAARIEAP
jgi:hypothetical protein